MEEPGHSQPSDRADRGVNLLIVLGLGVILASIYGPLALWLGRAALTIEQLHNGALIVLFALVISLRRAVRGWRFAPQANNLGIALMAAGIGCLFCVRWLPPLSLPVALLSFCLSLAGLAALLFGAAGARALVPAMVGILLLGILAGLASSLDWPLRSMAARASAELLQALGADVRLGLRIGQPPQLLLAVRGRVFNVAAECNGFGLLASSLLIAAILGFHYRISWPRKVGLFLLAAPLALLFNAIRIVAISLTATHVGLPYLLIHEGIGVCCYATALALLWWLARRGRPAASEA